MKAVPRRACRPLALLPGFLLSIILWSGSVHAQDGIDCGPVIENFRGNVESAPSHVLTLLEDVLIANGGHCVPQFVETAIEASNADAETVKKIVFVAITNAQSQAPQIAEAAVAASPKHADAVREAFAEAFSDENPRLKPAKPADQPAWAEENAPVPPPATPPTPKPAPAPTPEPEPEPTPQPITPPPVPQAPAMAATASQEEASRYRDLDAGDEGWKLLHDGVVNQPPIDPQNLVAAGGGNTAAPDAPEPVEPPLPETKDKKRFSFSLPSLALPKLPSLPEASEPVDLFFHPPFGGVPGGDAGS